MGREKGHFDPGGVARHRGFYPPIVFEGTLERTIQRRVKPREKVDTEKKRKNKIHRAKGKIEKKAVRNRHKEDKK